MAPGAADSLPIGSLASDASVASPADMEATTYRMRFFNFNMANSSGFHRVSELQGPDGTGDFDSMLTAPLADGGAVDLAFCTFVETRLAISEWLAAYSARSPEPLDAAISQNAMRAGMKFARSQVQGMLQGWAADYNGNLKTLIAFSSRHFDADDESAKIFGRFDEDDTQVAGVKVPNPKKAFIGYAVRENVHRIRLVLTGAHFPITSLAQSLEKGNDEAVIYGAKVAMARTLRRVLRKAAQRALLDEFGVLVLQGDLNSRTVLLRDGATDALLALMEDDMMQAAITHGLSLLPGRFREVAPTRDGGVWDLPVTYKYNHQVGSAFKKSTTSTFSKQSRSTDSGSEGMDNFLRTGTSSSSTAAPSFTVGDVLTASGTWPSASKPHLGRGSGPSGPLYKSTLEEIPQEKLDSWGVTFKRGYDFKPFRFPSAADRVVYWAPDALAERMSWSFPNEGGYHVNHLQGGSDHRPVFLEAVLHVAPDPASSSGSPSKRAAFRAEPEQPDATLLAAICVDEEEEEELSSCEEDDEMGGLPTLPLFGMRNTMKKAYSNWFGKTPPTAANNEFGTSASLMPSRGIAPSRSVGYTSGSQAGGFGKTNSLKPPSGGAPQVNKSPRGALATGATLGASSLRHNPLDTNEGIPEESNMEALKTTDSI